MMHYVHDTNRWQLNGDTARMIAALCAVFVLADSDRAASVMSHAGDAVQHTAEFVERHRHALADGMHIRPAVHHARSVMNEQPRDVFDAAFEAAVQKELTPLYLSEYPTLRFVMDNYGDHVDTYCSDHRGY